MGEVSSKMNHKKPFKKLILGISQVAEKFGDIELSSERLTSNPRNFCGSFSSREALTNQSRNSLSKVEKPNNWII